MTSLSIAFALGLSLQLMACHERAIEPAETIAGKDLPRASASGSMFQAECQEAADCVLVPVACCDCSNGGSQRSVSKKAASASSAEREKRCKDQMCAMVMSSDPSCTKRANCFAGHCVLK